MFIGGLLRVIHFQQPGRIKYHEIANLRSNHITISRIDNCIGLFIDSNGNTHIWINRVIGTVIVLVKVELVGLSLDPVELHCQIDIVYREFILITSPSVITQRLLNISSFIRIQGFNQTVRSCIGLTCSAIARDHDLAIVGDNLYSIIIGLCTGKVEQLTSDHLIITTKLHKPIVDKLWHIKLDRESLTISTLHLHCIGIDIVFRSRGILYFNISNDNRILFISKGLQN